MIYMTERLQNALGMIRVFVVVELLAIVVLLVVVGILVARFAARVALCFLLRWADETDPSDLQCAIQLKQ